MPDRVYSPKQSRINPLKYLARWLCGTYIRLLGGGPFFATWSLRRENAVERGWPTSWTFISVRWVWPTIGPLAITGPSGSPLRWGGPSFPCLPSGSRQGPTRGWDPLASAQGYLICISCMMGWSLSRLPEWTAARVARECSPCAGIAGLMGTQVEGYSYSHSFFNDHWRHQRPRCCWEMSWRPHCPVCILYFEGFWVVPWRASSAHPVSVGGARRGGRV